MSYRKHTRDDLSVNLGAGLGAYVLYSVSTTTDIRTYVKDSGDWKRGDVDKDIWRTHFTAVTPGGEGSIGFAYELSPSISVGITGRIILISKIENLYELTSYYKTNWEPAEPQLMTIKLGEEYGGMGWGIGASVIF